MANNLDILDATGTTKTVKTTDTAGVHVPHHNIDSLPALAAGTNNIGDVDVLSSALPTGASTAANQTTIIGHVDGIEGLLTTIDADTGSILTSAQSIDGKITACNTGAVVISSGTVTTVSTVTNLAQMAGAAIAMGTGVRSAGTQRVTIATDDVVPVTGTFWQATQPVSLTSTTVTGTVAVTQSGTWDEVGINDSGNSITVDNGGTFAVQAACTNAGTFAVQVDGSALTSLQLIDDAVYTDDAAFTPGTSKVLGVGFEADEGSTDSVDEGDIGAARMTLDRKQIVTVQPHTAGGLSLFRSLDLDESEEEVKATAGCLYKLRITNFSTSIRYVKLYNATAASVTVGSTTPIDTIPVPGATSATQPTVITESYGGIGLTFDTALSAAATTALADADTGAPGANEIVLSAYYK